jgi:hypothetical protein
MTRRDALPNFYAILDAARWTARRARPVLPALAFLLLLVYVIANARGGQALEQELSLIRGQGEPLSLSEAAPPPVPDSQNAAQVYAQAFARLSRHDPAPAAADPNGDRLTEADSRVLDHFLSDDPRRRQTVSTEQVRQVLAGTDAALALARRAAAMPRCRFPVNWEAGAGALFPHYPKLLSLSRLLGAHAILASMDGKPADAVADNQAIVGIARHILAEPVLIGNLVAFRCLSMARNSLRRSMEVAPLTEAQSRQLYQAWAAIDLQAPFYHTVETERCLGLWVFDVTRNDPAKLAALAGNEEHPAAVPYRLGPLGESLRKMDEVWYLQFMAREVEWAKQADTTHRADRSDELNPPWYAAVSRMMLPAFEHATRKRNEAIAGLALTQWALALAVYQQQTGHFPASLQEAKGRIDWNLPNDPFTGQNLVYRPQGSGYLLYSVGENHRDDEGRNWNERARSAGGPVAPGQDDIAWWFVP